jgi:hypothetical protein
MAFQDVDTTRIAGSLDGSEVVRYGSRCGTELTHLTAMSLFAATTTCCEARHGLKNVLSIFTLCISNKYIRMTPAMRTKPKCTF